MEIETNNKFQNILSEEKGVVLILLAILIPTIIYLLSITLNVGYSSILRADLQSAADAAALAGARGFNGQLPGWQQTRADAIEVVKRQNVHGALGDATGIPLSIDVNDKIDIGGKQVDRVVWDFSGSDNLRISIRRGIWLGNQFRTMEDADVPTGEWQTYAGGGPGESNRGLPRIATANAVQVIIERPEVGMLVPASGGNDTYSAGRSAVAVSGNVGRTTAAPLAIPVCGLVYQNQNDYEMWFGGGRETPICQGDRLFSKVSRHTNAVVPEFSWDPEWYLDTSAEPVPDMFTCNWFNRRFFDLRDHFGVLGLPGSGGNPSEQDIRNAIISGGVQAQMGQNFSISEDGLTESESRMAAWNQINNGGTTNSSHPSFNNPAGDLIGVVLRNLPDYWNPGCPNNPGICNSRRVAHNIGNCSQNYVPPVNDSTPVWHVSVPVIADLDSTGTCGDGFGGTTDPTLSSSNNYQIIGFLKSYIYDVDIATAPPNQPGGCASTPNVWGFNESCNLIRGRVDCFSNFVSSSESVGNRTPVLIEPI